METSQHFFVERRVGEEQDSQGNTMTVWESESLGGTRAMGLFMSTYAELIDKGYATPHMSWMDGNKINVVYLYDEQQQQVAGGIAFDYRPVSREGWILLSFTAPEFRGRRINQIAHRYFENIIRRRGGYKIASHVHVNNQARLRASERVGLKPEFYRMSKRIDLDG